MERETGFEPATSTLARSHSTTELFPLAGTPKLPRPPSPTLRRVWREFPAQSGPPPEPTYGSRTLLRRSVGSGARSNCEGDVCNCLGDPCNRSGDASNCSGDACNCSGDARNCLGDACNCLGDVSNCSGAACN